MVKEVTFEIKLKLAQGSDGVLSGMANAKAEGKVRGRPTINTNDILGTV